MENLTFKIGFKEYFVVKHPGVDSFLQKMKEHFNLVLWTAGTQEYADHVVDWLDPAGGIFYRRMYRQHYTFDSRINNYVKNLQLIKKTTSIQQRSVNRRLLNATPAFRYQSTHLYICRLRI